MLKAIGENLNARLKLSNLNQQDIAKISDLNRNTISTALAGKDIKLSTLIRITRNLDFTDWLIPLLNPPPPSHLSQLSKSNKQSKFELVKPSSRKLGLTKRDF
ncbi:helix-turn-helix domain-containing protein [Leptospira sp. GIMC2001]|uniref:helix-turn-helix domain-containing protein n=1 Tax=Leptospira sp. GIMC2001 TaxID=1513297 RepID=UPI0023497B25|nr:hypothetical protein [Leptospira sp. GIMC2001]WCL51001.1 hypothetical protein O4O04_09370 [Leptospira sp. GIMC2001]